MARLFNLTNIRRIPIFDVSPGHFGINFLRLLRTDFLFGHVTIVLQPNCFGRRECRKCICSIRTHLDRADDACRTRYCHSYRNDIVFPSDLDNIQQRKLPNAFLVLLVVNRLIRGRSILHGYDPGSDHSRQSNSGQYLRTMLNHHLLGFRKYFTPIGWHNVIDCHSYNFLLNLLILTSTLPVITENLLQGVVSGIVPGIH